MSMHAADLDFAVELAKRAGVIVTESYERTMQIDRKSKRDVVTDVDYRSEALVLEAIRDQYPADAILAEESGHHRRRSRGGTGRATTSRTWVIDPLDGTTNYAHGFPWFCVSIALEVDGEVRLGVIYQPMLDELFTAVKGEGAFLNGRLLRVSRREPLKNCLLATGFPYDRTRDNENNFANFVNFQMAARAVRRAGAAALDLANVAAGRLDGYWEVKLKPWDVAAGQLLVTEAGGRVTNHAGEPFSIYDHRVLASNGLVHDAMVALLKG